MEKIKGNKCGYGYIHQQKIFQTLMLLFFIAVGVGLFLIGLAITGTRANVFTVLGILMVLPGAKRVIALVVMFPHKSVERERYEAMKASLSEEAVLLTDYVFTSPEKVMSLDFVVIDREHVIGVPGAKSKNIEYMQQYLHKGVGNVDSSYRVKICSSEEEFHKFYDRMVAGKKEGKPSEEVIAYLKVLAV